MTRRQCKEIPALQDKLWAPATASCAMLLRTGPRPVAVGSCLGRSALFLPRTLHKTGLAGPLALASKRGSPHRCETPPPRTRKARAICRERSLQRDDSWSKSWWLSLLPPWVEGVVGPSCGLRRLGRMSGLAGYSSFGPQLARSARSRTERATGTSQAGRIS